MTPAARRALWIAVALAFLNLPAAGRAGHDSMPDVVALRSDYVKRLVDAREAIVLVDMRKDGFDGWLRRRYPVVK